LCGSRYEDAAVSAHEGMRMEEGVNTALHKVFQKAIELGRKEHQEKLMAAAQDGEKVKA
jgi:glutamyl-tRNA reductase